MTGSRSGRISNMTRGVRGGHGFVLPMSVMVIGGLLILMVGLLSVMRLERRTARSYSDGVRAEFALQSGLAEAKVRLAQTAADGALVFRCDQTADSAGRERFLTYGAVFDEKTAAVRIVPLVSGLAEIPVAALANPQAPQDLTTIARLGTDDRVTPQARWVDVPTTDGYTMRFGYWVEDLGGRLDGSMAGPVVRTAGGAAEELGLFTLFRPGEDKDGMPAGPEDKLIQEKDHLRTTGATRILLGKDDSLKCEPYLAYGLPQKQPEQVLVPYGFGYRDQGKPAFDLNAAVTARDYEGIAGMITRNLPSFDARRGGLAKSVSPVPNELAQAVDYVKTIAASMIDYADEDNEPTIVDGNRGMDAYPLVNEYFNRYEWVAPPAKDPNAVVIQVRTFVELWNLTDRTVQGEVRLSNVNRDAYIIAAQKPRMATVELGPVTVSIAPNGFKVLELLPADGKPVTYTFNSGGATAIGAPLKTAWGSGYDYDSSYKLWWNGKLIDSAPGGWRVPGANATLNAGSSNRKWKGFSSPALDESIGQWGDPRASNIITAGIFNNNYDENTSWGGRALKAGITNTAYRETQPSHWPDCGSNSTAGTPAGSDAKLPTELIYPIAQPKLAPAHISNAGRYFSVGELGNIFDPAQWSDVRITGGAASSQAGGGITLAIGRPEYKVFDTDGKRASQLTDLFTVDTKALRERRGMINVNTASRSVLRALVAGTVLDDDPAFPAQVVPRATEAGDRFADAVIETRNKRPLRGLSDLAQVQAGNLAFFGERMQWSAATRPPAEWRDAGREELFSKVARWAVFGSKSYAVWVTGQVLSPAGEVVASRSRVIHLTVVPPRDETGKTTGNPPQFVVSYERVL